MGKNQDAKSTTKLEKISSKPSAHPIRVLR
jgi:hypothetical protein